MTRAKKPNVLSAAVDLGFAVLAGALGGFGAPGWSIGVLVFAHLAYWAHTRRNTLARTAPSQRLGVLIISFLMIVLVDAAAYGIGLGMKGMGP